jgi:DNA-binding NtrC family response regulator
MKVLVVDDEEKFGRLVAGHLSDAGHDVTALASGTAALKALSETSYDVVVTDVRMAPVTGMEVLNAAKAASPETEVVMMTAYGAVDVAVAAMRQGAYDFITKPFSLDELVLILERIQEKRALKDENRALKQELVSSDRFAEMVGSSPALAQVRALVAKVAPSDASVLVLGESGVGKELVARLIHRSSRRADRSFVVVHAAALPETLLESELFGYEKGAFTGASARKPGRLEMAAGGTLLLDEIGDITPAFQVKLLRFLQEKTFVRLGGSETISVDSRIVTATNRNLQQEVQEGRFREDLYYRLAVFPIQVPPLRERKTDIAPLTRHILDRLGYRRELDREAMRLLNEYDWPGNIRELENVLERAMILAGTDAIGPEHIQLPEPVGADGRRLAADGLTDVRRGELAHPDGRLSLFEMERQMLEDALRRSGGNKSKAARLLGITRRMLYTKLEKCRGEGGLAHLAHPAGGTVPDHAPVETEPQTGV